MTVIIPVFLFSYCQVKLCFIIHFVKVHAMPSILPIRNLSFPLQMIQDDLAELVAQMEEVEKLGQLNTTHKHEMNQLSSDSQALKIALKVT